MLLLSHAWIIVTVYTVGYQMEIDKPQRVQNCAARLVSGTRRSDHITPVMKDLHSLPIGHWRTDFKTLLYTFKILNDLAPYYLPSLLLKY